MCRTELLISADHALETFVMIMLDYQSEVTLIIWTHPLGTEHTNSYFHSNLASSYHNVKYWSGPKCWVNRWTDSQAHSLCRKVQKLFNRNECHLLPLFFCSKINSHKGKPIEPQQTAASAFNIFSLVSSLTFKSCCWHHIVQGCLVLGLLPERRYDFTFINRLFSHSKKRDVSHEVNAGKMSSFFSLFLPPFSHQQACT